MKVTIHNQQKDLVLPIKSLKQQIEKFLLHKKVRCSSVVIHYVTKNKISQIHQDFFDDPSPTDCISLPIDSPKDDHPFSVLGEVFVCPKVALEYTEGSSADPQEETLLYTIHGLLHLLGFDDISTKDRAVMRREEKKALNFINS